MESARNVGIMYVTQSVMTCILSPLLGIWSDKIGRKPVLLFCQTWALIVITTLAVSLHFKLLWLMFLARLITILLAVQVWKHREREGCQY